MKLLLFTQALDTNDPVLSAYHRLVAAIAGGFDHVTAVCLKKGACDLPKNVTALSLGKEEGGDRFVARLRYVWRFYTYIFSTAGDYDAVFVHMNQEYVILGGIFWKLMGKRVYMWRNHHAGTHITDLAAAFCTNVFCTSKLSYTAKYRKTILMPVGVDATMFRPVQGVVRAPRSIIFLARMAPVKKPDVLVEALGILKDEGGAFTASFYGDPLPKDAAYYASLKEKAAGIAKFYPGMPNDQTPKAYSAHDICVNLSSSGMYDKTIFEAMMCEALSVSSNANLEGVLDERLLFKEGDAVDLARALSVLLALSPAEKDALRAASRRYAEENHSLASLSKKLSDIISAS